MHTKRCNRQDTVELGLTSLPDELLLNICRSLQSEAISTKVVRDARGPPLRPTQRFKPPGSIPAFLALRQCCKALRSASDSVRTSIRFHVDDMEEVEPYLCKLPSLNTVAIDGNDQDDDISDGLFTLKKLVPGLESLTLRNGGQESYDPYDESWHSNLAELQVSCLLQWISTLRHLELHKVCFIKDEDNEAQSTYNLSHNYHDNLGFLSKFPALNSLRLENVLPCLASPDLLECTGLQHLHIKMLPMTDSPSNLKLDLSSCTLLRELYCCNSQLDTLDVSGCALLEVLDVASNQLDELDLSNKTSLKTLFCFSNYLERVVLTGCSALTVADMGENLELSTVETNGCSALVSFLVNDTNVEVLDLSGCLKLKKLECTYAPLLNLNLSGCSAMEGLELRATNAVSINLTGMTGLKKLSCPVSTVTSLILTGCTALRSLDLQHTLELTSLDLSSCHMVKKLELLGSGLVDLDLTGCPLLQKVDGKKGQKGRAGAVKRSRIGKII